MQDIKENKNSNISAIIFDEAFLASLFLPAKERILWKL